ncbi:MAG: saccharopine dehydrogenase NADP-binding domain-containing protein, partial [Actinomycetia bacterium]|nr:saccharopine dehydrogenase NADP-binding domain-containing protein [Actinomycetes bacterium]
MTGRPPHVVLFGATGFTGRLTAAALVRRGVPVVLAGRSAARLAEVADEVGATHTAVADADDRRALADLLHEGDVLVSTVGPFLRHGRVPVTTALDTGATYLDSTGEPPFVRWVFEQLGPRAAKAGVALVPAFGYDYVPGNLA